MSKHATPVLLWFTTLLGFMLCARIANAQTETEPNNSFTQANHVPFSTTVTGSLACAAGDIDDYYRAVVPAGTKSLRLITNVSMASGSGSMYVYLYNKYQQQLTLHYLTFGTTNLLDTLDYTCYEGDTFYVRVYQWSGGCKNYSIRCENTNDFTYKNDIEPNDGFATAQGLIFQKDTTGHLASQRYLGGASDDNEDYYRCILPAGTKTLRLITTSRMVAPGTSGSMYYYLYNKYQQQLTNMYVTFGTTARTDTLDYTCFEGDTFYVRVYQWSGACKEYRIKADFTNQFTLKNDTEPNDGFASAQELIFQKDTTGHLASQRYLGGASQDNEDYYRCVLPPGTKSLRLISASRMAQPGATGSVYYYLYNKYQQQLTNHYITFGNALVVDTLDYDCFEGDTFFVRVYHWSGGCKEYRIRADFTNTFTLKNDTEPNDNFATAQGLIFQKDTTGHLTSQRYIGGASQDNEDYYRCILPSGGTKSLRLITTSRMVAPGTSGSMYYYLYNKYQQQLTNMYVTFGNTTRRDTLDYTCFEGDTFYVRVYHWSGPCKEYSIKAGYTNEFTLQNDGEPNDNFTDATDLPFQKDTTGHLASHRYLGVAPSQDNEDYYRCVLPPGGKSLRLITSSRMVQPGASGSLYYYLYNKYQQQLTNMYLTVGSNARVDTLDFTCFEGDTFYVRIYQWSGPCKEYRIRTDYSNEFTFANDKEPNENIASATTVPFETNSTGHLGTQLYGGTAARTDGEDYFRVVAPQNGLGLRLIVNSRTAATGTGGNMYVHVYNKAGNSVGNRYLSLGNTLKADTLDFPCFTADTVYVRFQDWSGACKEFSFRLQNMKTGPVAPEFETARFGNNFSFINRTKFATRYQWTFGSAGTDTVAFPARLFPIGTHIVRLNATNACGTKTFIDTIYVNGIEYYTPKEGGSENRLGMFHIRAFGAGLDSNLVMKLKNASGQYTPERKRSPSQSEFTGWFNFKTVPPGTYDVEITLSNNQVFNYPNGFTVYVDSPGFNITTEIYSPTRVRTGRMNWYALRVHNKKGRDANGVRAFIITSRGMQTTIKDVLYKRTGKLVIKGSDYDNLTMDRQDYANLYYGGDFDPNRDTIEVDYDKIYSVSDSLTSFNIDSLYGEPFKGTVYPISIPYIKAKGTHTIQFQAATPANGDFKLVSYVWPWTVRENPVSGEALDYIHETGMQAAALAEYAPNPALKAVGKSAGYVDIGSQIAFTEFFDWYYGTNVADDAFYAKQGVSLAGEVAGELVPFGKKADAAVDQANNARRQLGRHTEHLAFDNDLILSGIKDPNLARHMSDRLEFLKNGIDQYGKQLTRAEKEAALNATLDWATKQGINLTQKEIEKLMFPQDKQQKNVQSLQSFDPNAIYGPDGPGRDHYMRRDRPMNFEVTFENVDTALAPAQIVRVEVLLDTNKYDIRQTTLNNVRLGGKLYQFEEDRQEYFRDIDLRPAHQIIVRVNAKTDTVKGKLYWEFISLDPITKNLLTDVDSGFLPPNNVSPEGEGAVSFSTRLKPGILNRDSVSAFATIWFDENDPILTNTWINKVDEGTPTSSLNPVVQVMEDTVMQLNLSGTDGESGFQEYRLYVKKNDSAWSKNPYPINDITGRVIIGKIGEKYSFYVEGRDSVGIWEHKTPTTEATVTLTKTGPVQPNVTSIFPNPAQNSVTVRVVSPEDGALHISITNVSGQAAAVFEQQHRAGTANYVVPTSSLQPGIYFVEVLLNNNKIDFEKLTIVR